MSFITPLIAEEAPPNKWELYEPLVYERIMPMMRIPLQLVEVAHRVDWLVLLRDSRLRPIGYRITVPAGFVSDLASIPRLFRALIEVNGPHRKAAALHDWLYYQAPLLARGYCDWEFDHAMACCDVSWLTSKTMYAGVRAGGWVAYGKHKKRNLSEVTA